jgi:hypothetical protein
VRRSFPVLGVAFFLQGAGLSSIHFPEGVELPARPSRCDVLFGLNSNKQ